MGYFRDEEGQREQMSYKNRAIVGRIDLPSRKTIIAVSKYSIVGQGISEENKDIADWITEEVGT